MAYASKYYDPVKRHEYYMKHRQLKGRQGRGSTAALNEDGRIAAKEVKAGLMAERKEALRQLKEQMDVKIKALKDRLKGMSRAEKAGMRDQIRSEIEQLRAENKEQRQKFKEYYDERYLQELDKIRQDSSFKKKEKSGRKK